MGEVYRAKDPRLGREVAIKVLPASFSQDADRLRRFEQEAKAAGVLNHPNITAVYARYTQTWAISPDEKFLFVNRATEQADIWLATLE
jgi:serine/threonine protein kinase